MARLSMSFLGSLTITLDGESVTGFESNKVRALLAYLATESARPHSREALAALFWPDWPQQSAMSNLRYVLADLRKNIGDRDADPPFLLITRDNLQFNLDSDCFLDLTEFERLAGEANFHAAISLYRSPLLDGFVVSDSAPFEEWLTLKREQLNRQVLRALHNLAEGHEGRGEYADALPFAWKQVEIAPWMEEAHQQLMRLLALSGQRSAALAQFEACRKALAKELNVTPSAETLALYEQIHSGEMLHPIPLRRGKTIEATFQNRYQLGPELGRGGMSVVYRAHDTLLDRDVAIKVLSVEILGEEGRARLLREAQMIAHFNHPHIVSVHDIGEVNGAPCVVMELIAGGTLRDKRPTDMASVITITRQVCAALEHAHAQGIIHRDLKPDNVMLTADGTVKLMDFGLARSTTGPQLTQEGVIIGTLRYLAPELILGENATPQSDLYSLGAMLYEIVAGQPLFGSSNINEIVAQHLHAPVPPPSGINPGIPPELDALIVRLLAKRPAERPASALEVGQMLEGMQSAEAPAPGEAPFKGLLYFEEADAARFFGREALTERLIAHIDEMAGHRTRMKAEEPTELNRSAETPNLLAVVGASGSGKSSLVRAGVLAQIRQAHPDWPVYVLTPTAHPLETLAASLTRHIESFSATAALMDDLARDPRSLSLFIRRAVHIPEGAHLMLVVDQFEEIFTLCHDEAERAAFLDNLLTALGTPPLAPPHPKDMDGEGKQRHRGMSEPGPVIGVLALRADFYAHCAHYPRLREALCARQEYIGPMNTAEIRCAIERPALQAGWEFDSGLVELILRDTGASEDHPPEPGALPLLSHALLETWQRRSGRKLTLRGYHEAGGVHGAIAHTAESVFARLSPEEQTLARRIFLRLTELGEGTQDTRRRAPLTELTPHAAEGQRVQTVLKILADTRLVTLSEGVAEVAHEALIREWPTLREWLNEDRRDLRIQRHLTESAQAWDLRGREVSDLYRGSRLTTAVEWSLIADHADAMSRLEVEFLQASHDFADQEAQEREAQRQRELEAAQKLAEAEKQRAAVQEQAAAVQTQNAKRLRQRAWVLSGALLVALVMIAVAVFFGWRANRQAKESYASELNAAAIANLSVDPERSLLLGIEAANTWQALGQPIPDSLHDTFNQALWDSRALLTWSFGDDHVAYVGFRPSDGKPWAVTGKDGQATLWDIEDNQAILTVAGPISLFSRTDVSPDGKTLAFPGEGDTLNLWEIDTGLLKQSLAGNGGEVTGAAFSLDGKWLAAFSDVAGKYTLWQLATGQKVAEYPSSRMESYAVFSPDSQRLAMITPDTGLAVVEIPSGKILLEAPGPDYMTLAFSPDGKTLAAAGRGPDGLLIWDIQTGKIVHQFKMVVSVQVYGIAFTPNGWVTDGKEIWDTVWGQRQFSLQAQMQDIKALALRADGTRLITASLDGTIKVWNMTAPHRNVLTLPTQQEIAMALAFSPDGNWLATSGFEPVVKIWDVSSIYKPGDPQAALVKQFASGHTDMVGSLAFSPDGNWLAAASGDRTVKVWDTRSWQEKASFLAAPEDLPQAFTLIKGVTSLAFSPECDAPAGSLHQRCLLAYAGMSGQVSIRDILTGELLFSYQEKIFGVTRIAFSPDGKRLAIGLVGGSGAFPLGQIKILDLTIGHASDNPVIQELPSFNSWVMGLAFSPDGKRLAAITTYSGGYIWELATGKTIPLSGSRGGLGLAFSPDGKLLVTNGQGQGLPVWDPTTGRLKYHLRGAGQQIEWGIQFSPDGRYIATAGGAVLIYAVQPDNLLDEARQRLTRTWRLEECQQYLHTDTCPPDPRER